MRRSFTMLVLATVLVLVGASCAKKKDTGFPPPPPSPTGSETAACVVTTDTAPVEVTGPIEIGDSFFAPITGSVKAGTKIDWKQCGSAPHTVTFDTLKIDSSPDCPKDTAKCLATGSEFSTTITKAGKYHYYCKIHGVKGADTGMYGYIVVT